MNFKTTLILVALLAVVGGYWLAFEWGRAPAPETGGEAAANDQSGEPLFAEAPEPGAINRITLQREGRTVALERQHGQWMQTEPVRFPLNNSAINNLISDITSLRYAERFAKGAARAPSFESARLASPRATVTLAGADKSWTVKLGDQYVAGSAYLATGDDEAVYVVKPTVHETVLNHTVRRWRQTSITAPKASAADRITLNRGGPDQAETIELTRRDDRWYLGEGERAGSKAVSSLADAVGNLSIQKFVADTPKNLGLYGLASPQLTIAMQSGGGTSNRTGENESGGDNGQAIHTDGANAGDKAAGPSAGNETSESPTVLKVGQPTDMSEANYFATWSSGDTGEGVVFTISQSTVENLRKTPAALRDPRIVNASQDEVQQLHIERPDDQPIDIRRDPEAGFVFGEPDPGYAVDYKAAADLIGQITTAEASGYQPGFEPTDDPIATLTLTHRGSGERERVRLYATPNEASAATQPDSNAGTQLSDTEQGDTDETDAATQTETAAPATEQATYLAVREQEPVAYRVKREAVAGLFEPLLTLRKKTILDIEPTQLARLTLRRDDGTQYTFYPNHANRSDDDASAATQSAADDAAERSTAGDQTTAATHPTDEGQGGQATWRLEAQQQFEREAFNQLLQAMQPLRVERWVTGSVAPPSKPVELTLHMQGGETRTLRVAAASREATLDTIEPAFVLPASFVEKLNAEYRDRTAIAVKPDAIEQVLVLDADDAGEADNEQPANTGADNPRANGGPSEQLSRSAIRSGLASYQPDQPIDAGLRLTRDESSRFVSPSTDESINQSAAGSLFDRLGGLEVKRYISAPAGDLGKVARRVRATTNGGDTFELVMMQDTNRAWLHGRVDGRAVSQWVTLTDDARGELMQTMTGQSSPSRAGRPSTPSPRPGPRGPGPGGAGAPGGARQLPPAVRRQLQQRMQQQRRQQQQ